MPRAKGGSIKPPRVVVNPGDGGLISELNNNDVLSGRGGRINNHPGNITFRLVCQDYKHEYLDPRTRKLEKAHVAARLVTQIRSTNPPGRFLKEDQSNPGFFIEIGDQKAWKSEFLFVTGPKRKRCSTVLHSYDESNGNFILRGRTGAERRRPRCSQRNRQRDGT